MAFLQPALSPPRAPTKKSTLNSNHNDIDEFLSSDLELSFASTMSLNSPVRSGVPSPAAMDISPAPVFSTHLAPSAPRLFGRDMVNEEQSLNTGNKDDTTSKNKGRQRTPLPSQWMLSKPSPQKDCIEGISLVPSPSDAMDVDIPSSSPMPPASLVNPALPAPPPPAPILPSANYSNLFFDASPEPCAAHKKRRSTSPDLANNAVSSDPPSSPSRHKFSRAATIGTGGSLFKKPALEYNAPSNSRTGGRRPTISALINPAQQPQSAYPILCEKQDSADTVLPPPRRAFSAMINPRKGVEPSSDDFSDAQSSSPAAAYAKRHQARVIRRCDGSEDLRPANGAGSLSKRDREHFADKGCSPRSLAGFGVNEVMNKILPCHRVSEDGLVRITASTLTDLLNGIYAPRVNSYTIVDCRFDYEYVGGHIPGAINLNTVAAAEEYFLGPHKPTPSESGDPTAKDIIVFHCEFSVKRAPTFAKHVRARDRAVNGRVYPKVCYPEIYILEGGYSQFYKEFPTRCEPRGYVQMDDPAHTKARDEDMNNFRRGRWARTQSYTYGQKSAGLPSFPSISAPTNPSTHTASRENRKTAPSGGLNGSGGTMFAAANAARGRRTVNVKGLSTLDEDASSSAFEEGDSLDLHDSPCPPPSKSASRLSLLVTSNRLSRTNTDRAVSFGPSRR